MAGMISMNHELVEVEEAGYGLIKHKVSKDLEASSSMWFIKHIKAH